MNKEDYVSLEVAKMLKDKGFDEPCNYFYREGGSCDGSPWSVDYNKDLGRYSKPTLYEAQKWLRSKCICVDVSVYSKFVWGYTIYTFDENNCINGNYNEEEYKSYEEALNEGILESLKLI